MPPLLYVDPQSPYAYLADARAGALLGVEPELRPIALGPLFARRGYGSWAHTARRAANVAEVEARAAAAGLPPVRWPADWPAQSLGPARALTWAAGQDAARAWVRAYWRAVFASGRPAGALATLEDAAREAGLDAGAVPAALRDPALKLRLREWTDEAWDAGVRGVPTLRIAARLFYGDDRLEAAAVARLSPG